MRCITRIEGNLWPHLFIFFILYMPPLTIFCYLWLQYSACYAALKQWQKAYEDALQCIAKDPKFIKGYYRLSSAQTELKLFDDSLSTLRAALTLEPGEWHVTSCISYLDSINQHSVWLYLLYLISCRILNRQWGAAPPNEDGAAEEGRGGHHPCKAKEEPHPVTDERGEGDPSLA